MSNEYEHSDRRDAPYNNVPAPTNIATWLQFSIIIGAMIVSWTTLNTTITKIDVNQANIKEDLQKLETEFVKHHDVHFKNLEDVKDQVQSLENSVTTLYRMKSKQIK